MILTHLLVAILRTTALLQAFFDERPAKPKAVKHPFTAETKAARLAAMKEHHWTTARKAFGWAWNELGLRVSLRCHGYLDPRKVSWRGLDEPAL